MRDPWGVIARLGLWSAVRCLRGLHESLVCLTFTFLLGTSALPSCFLARSKMTAVVSKTLTTPALKTPRIMKNMSAVSGAMMLGDVLCQGMETFDSGRKFAWDHGRTMRMGITGAFIVTPASLSWNIYAERIAPGTSWRAVLIKLGVSIAVLPPMLATQFASLTLLDPEKNTSDLYRKMERDFVPTLKNAVMFWPLVSVVNSAFVPVLSRPMFSSFAGVFWNVYVSYQANHNGMEVGELSMVYPEVPGEAFAVGGARVEKQTAAEEAAEQAALLKTKIASEAAKKEEGGGVASAAVKATKEEEEGGKEGVSSKKEGGAAPAEPPSRKRRGRFVRRTTVVSM